MPYIISGFYDGCGSGGSGIYTPPVITTYFPLQTKNNLNPIDSEPLGATKYETLWIDSKKWDDNKTWYDVWSVNNNA